MKMVTTYFKMFIQILRQDISKATYKTVVHNHSLNVEEVIDASDTIIVLVQKKDQMNI